MARARAHPGRARSADTLWTLHFLAVRDPRGHIPPMRTNQLAACTAETAPTETPLAEVDDAPTIDPATTTTPGASYTGCYRALTTFNPGSCSGGWRVPYNYDWYVCNEGGFSAITRFSPVPCSNNPPSPQ